MGALSPYSSIVKLPLLVCRTASAAPERMLVAWAAVGAAVGHDVRGVGVAPPNTLQAASASAIEAASVARRTEPAPAAIGLMNRDPRTDAGRRRPAWCPRR